MTPPEQDSRRLRILHVGTGFRPYRRGGLVAYVEDLIEEQVGRGHEVAYLFSGREYPWRRRPRLRRWQRGGVAMLEIVNSPLFDHGRQPALELEEPGIETIARRVHSEVDADIVHVHELAGLPSSLLDVLGEGCAPVILTLQDYFPLCPAFKLVDADGRICLRHEVGADCVATMSAEERDPALLFEASLLHDWHRFPPARMLPRRVRSRLGNRLAEIGSSRARRYAPTVTPALAAPFQRRREFNVERLNGTDLLIAMSTRVAQIYEELGVAPDRLRTVRLTLRHIAELTPRQRRPTDTLTFATLGGAESELKGARVLLDALAAVSDLRATGRMRMLIFGWPDAAVADAAARLPGVEVRGSFAPAALDAMLDEVDVGIVPSVWEEAYGYAGVEFLAKGIPVIGNAIGGIVDYVRDGETGWLNRSCSAYELAAIIRAAVEQPHDVARLSEQVVAAHEEIALPMSGHAGTMDAIYRELIAERASTVAN